MFEKRIQEGSERMNGIIITSIICVTLIVLSIISKRRG